MVRLIGDSSGSGWYGQDAKDAFFAVFDRLGSTAAAARELGLNRFRCAGWVRKAGLKGRGKRGAGPHPGRDEFFELRGAGVNRRQAARAVGVNIRTAQDWDHGVRRSNHLRFYPDGRVVDYKQGVSTFHPPSDSAGSIDPRFLSLQEREMIRDLAGAGSSLRSIALALERSPSTISRELHRNSDPRLGYLPHGADRKAAARRARPKTPKLAGESKLRDYVQAGLGLEWSPEQISHRLVTDHPDDQEMRVSPETIYQALYLQARGGLKREIQGALRTGRARRKPQNTTAERRPRFADPMVMISERPPEIEDRAIPGHWEGDLVRHEALFDRAEVEDLRRCAVAAA